MFNVVYLQRRWRARTMRRNLERRIAARKVMVRALTAWLRRLRLKWRRAHATTLVNFLCAARKQKLSKTAVAKYRHLIVFVQRRWRAYACMWQAYPCPVAHIPHARRCAQLGCVWVQARLELAERQFQRVAEVMAAQPERAAKGLPMSYRRKACLRRVARDINDDLAAAKALSSLPSFLIPCTVHAMCGTHDLWWLHPCRWCPSVRYLQKGASGMCCTHTWRSASRST